MRYGAAFISSPTPLPNMRKDREEMIIGKIYKFKKEIDNKDFSFGYQQGCFIGYTASRFPRFMLNIERGTECFINATDENFEQVVKRLNVEEIMDIISNIFPCSHPPEDTQFCKCREKWEALSQDIITYLNKNNSL